MTTRSREAPVGDIRRFQKDPGDGEVFFLVCALEWLDAILAEHAKAEPLGDGHKDREEFLLAEEPEESGAKGDPQEQLNRLVRVAAGKVSL